MRKPRFSKLLSKKVLLSIGALGVAGAMAGLGTFASFTSTTSSSNTATSGTVIINVGADGPANRFSVSSGTLVPGDTVQRAINLISTGTTGDLGSVTLTTTATTSSLLNTDGTNGLQMAISNCSVPWTEAGTSPALTYTCGGTPSSVLGSVPVIGAGLALSNLSIVNAVAGTDHLVLTLTLPSGTGNTFQGLTSTVLYTFNGTQRSAGSR